MADVIVYGAQQSTYTRTVRMALEEKGVAFELEPVDFAAEEYRALHPYGKIPAFRHGDVHLFETVAITDYIDRAFDGPALQPADAAAHARMHQWISATLDYVYNDAIRRYVLQIVFPKGPDGQPDMDTINAAREDIRHHLSVFDHALTGEHWLAGSELSLADLMLAPIVFYLTVMPGGKELMSSYPDLSRWFAAIAERPSFQATIPPLPSS